MSTPDESGVEARARALIIGERTHVVADVEALLDRLTTKLRSFMRQGSYAPEVKAAFELAIDDHTIEGVSLACRLLSTTIEKLIYDIHV